MTTSVQSILVTGATGFLGRHVCQTLLAQGFAVRALVLPHDPLLEFLDKRVTLFEGDLLDAHCPVEAFQGCHAVIHAAGRTNLRYQGRQRLHQLHVQGTRQACALAKTAGVRRMVFVSSIGVLGAHKHACAVSENEPAPNAASQFNTYHQAKRAAQDVALAAATPEFEVVSALPCMLWGEGDWQLSSTGLAWLAAHDRLPSYPRRGGISLLDVRDAAEGVVAALTKGAGNETYLLAGENFTNDAFYNQLLQVRHPHARARTLPLPLVFFLGWAAETANALGLAVDFSRDITSLCGLYWWGDASKAKRVLGFQPRYGGSDVIQRTVTWHRDHRILTRNL